MTKPLDPHTTHVKTIEAWMHTHLGITLTPHQIDILIARRARMISTPIDVAPLARTTTRMTSATRVINETPTHPSGADADQATREHYRS